MKKQLVVWLVIGVVVVGGLTLLETRRADNRKLSAAMLHQIATKTPEGTFGTYPKVHKVVCANCDKSGVQILADTIKTGGVVSQGAGRYDSNTGKITMVADEIRWEASLPAGMRPNFEHALRHEYGHAFLDDWLKAVGGGADSGKKLAFLPYTEGGAAVGNYPKNLRPVFREFRGINPNIYGVAYYTSTFGEFMAESYARFCEGKDVPPATTAFLRDQLKAR